METQPIPQQQSTPPLTSPTTKVELPNIPENWPGGWGAYKFSKQAVKRNWSVLLLLFVTNLVIATVSGAVLGKYAGHGIAFLVETFFEMAIISTLLASVRGQKLAYGASLKTVSLKLYINYVLSLIVLGIILGISLLLLVIPFFFVMPRLIFTPYFVIDKNMGPIEAIRASWEASKGHAGKIWGIIGVTFAFTLLAFTIIGIPFTVYFDFMYCAAFVVLYEYLEHISPTTPAASTVPVAATPPITNPVPPQVPTPPVAPQPPTTQPTPPRPLIQ
jgi:hypothetical protein